MRQTIKNWFLKYFTLQTLAVIAISLFSFSCGGSDDDDSFTDPGESKTETSSLLIGTWNNSEQR